MALTGLHANWQRGSYNADRDYEIKKSEGLKLKPYYDKMANSVAIGYGCDLLKGDNVATIKSDLSSIGITLSSNDEQLLNDYRAGTKTLQDVLDKLTLALPSEPKASDLLALSVNRFQGQIDTALGYIMDESREKAVLVSMAFNGGLGLLQGATSDKSIINAAQQDDRIRAWYLIRYRRNGGGTASQGIANRRYRESDMFGLWSSGGPNSTELEKLETFFKKMDFYDSNISTLQIMRNREAEFTPKTTEANNSALIDEIINSPDFKAYFVAKYGQGQTIDGNVILGTELNNNIIASTRVLTRAEVERGYLKSTSFGDLILGEKGKDSINGGAGNDVIYGGEGNDTITGGTGNDLLMGGENNDTYIINTGDGTDTIEDKQGNNKVILCGKTLNFFYDKGNYQYSNADGTITAAMNGTDLVVTHVDSGTQVILNEDFQWGDFGINLLDMPEDPDPTFVIAGDLAPLNDPVHYDALGNVIVNPNVSSPDRPDTLFGSASNDRIEGMGGSDIVYDQGGNDWVLGGTGRDGLSTGDGSDIVEGGTEGDLLFGGAGDDQLFGEIKGEMDDLVTAGDSAQALTNKETLFPVKRVMISSTDLTATTPSLVDQAGKTAYGG
jgi:Ca2+-binding RTX toxin-like protein